MSRTVDRLEEIGRPPHAFQQHRRREPFWPLSADRRPYPLKIRSWSLWFKYDVEEKADRRRWKRLYGQAHKSVQQTFADKVLADLAGQLGLSYEEISAQYRGPGRGYVDPVK